MLETGEAMRLVLAALALGITIPVMVQLFLTLRQLQATIRRIDPSLEALKPSLEALKALVEGQANPPTQQPAGPQIATILAALIPAATAAYQAFRLQQASDSQDQANDSEYQEEQEQS